MISDLPLISVLLPVRDGGAWLAKAVASVLGQSWSNLELLLVDDHSRDDAVAELPRGDPRLRVLQATGKGLVAALNQGLAMARGEWLARMDADDLCHPQRLATQTAYLRANPRVDIVATCVAMPASEPESGWSRYLAWSNSLRDPESIERELFVESPLVHPSVLLPRALLQRLGGYRDGPFPEDYELWLRAAEAGCRFGKPEPPLLHWRDHPQRLTRTDPRYGAERFLALKASHLARWRLPQRPLWIGGAGPGGRRLHDALSGEGVDVAGFIDVHPRRIGGHKRGRPVWPRERLARMPGHFGLVAVGSPGARDRIRGELAPLGLVEGEDWIFTA